MPTQQETDYEVEVDPAVGRDVCVLNDEYGNPAMRYVIGEYLEYCHPFQVKPTWYRLEQGQIFSDRVFVMMVPAQERTPGGVIIPDKSRRKPMIGTVILHGDGINEAYDGTVIHLGVDFKAGDKVLFKPVSGQPLYWGKTQEIWHFRGGSFLAVLEDGYDPESNTGINWRGVSNEESTEEETVV